MSVSEALAALTTTLPASVLDSALEDPGSALNELPLWQGNHHQAGWEEGDMRDGLGE